jgi:hypothetical protein
LRAPIGSHGASFSRRPIPQSDDPGDYSTEGLRAYRIVNDADLTFSYYISDRTGGRPGSADDIVFTRWLCSCGAGGYALDTTTFRREVLTHLRSRHGSTSVRVVGNVQRCSPDLVAFIERQILG